MRRKSTKKNANTQYFSHKSAFFSYFVGYIDPFLHFFSKKYQKILSIKKKAVPLHPLL